MPTLERARQLEVPEMRAQELQLYQAKKCIEEKMAMRAGRSGGRGKVVVTRWDVRLGGWRNTISVAGWRAYVSPFTFHSPKCSHPASGLPRTQSAVPLQLVRALREAAPVFE